MFPLTITKIDGVVFQGDCLSLTCPGSEGEMTILKDHEPLVSALSAGTITVRTAGDQKSFPVKEGFITVSEEGVTVLV